MILIIEESPGIITFENTRSGHTFHAWLKEGSNEWIVTRYGHIAGVASDVWGRVLLSNGTWVGYAGTLRDVQPMICASRENAFEWITNDRAPDPG